MKIRCLIPGCVVAFAILIPARDAGAGLHKDEQLGYRIQVPSGWTEIPVKPGEKWVAARFLSEKDYRAKDPDVWGTHKPEVQVIIFPDAVTSERGVKRTTEEDGDVTSVLIEFKNPYKDYKDYLKRTYSGGGWFISEEEEEEKGDLSFTMIEIKVEKLARGGKKRLIAAVFHAEDADYVVQFEVLEDAYRKLRGAVYGSIGSFEFIPRRGSLAPEETGGPKTVDEEKLTPKERENRRMALAQNAFDRAVEKLPRGWDHFQYKEYFYVLSHVDRKFAQQACMHGEAVWKWIEKAFPYMGDEYVRPLIVRICADTEEESAYHGGGGGGWYISSGSEVVLSKGGDSYFYGSKFGELNDRILSNWFRDKEPSLYWSFPSWLKWGLDGLIGKATAKGSRLVFPEDGWQARELAVARSKGDLKPLKELLQSTRKDVGDAYSAQTGAVVRFLLDGPGRRHKVGKDFLERYIDAVRKYSDEREKSRAEELKNAAPDEKPKTEEEEEEEFKRRRQARNDWEEKEKEHLVAIFEKAFWDIPEARWQSLEKLYRAYLMK